MNTLRGTVNAKGNQVNWLIRI